MKMQSKEYKSHLKKYLIIWFVTIIALTFIYFTNYKKWVLPLGFTYWIWIIVMGNYERYRFINYLKNYYPKLCEEYHSGVFRKYKIIYSDDNSDDLYLNKAKKSYRNIILFARLQILMVPIIAIMVNIVKQFI